MKSNSERSTSSFSNRRRSLFSWVIAGLAAFILFIVLWVSIRGLIARNDLLGAAPIAHSVESAFVHGDNANMKLNIQKLQDRAKNAEELTSDPIWRLAEMTPALGPNLTAFRQAASMVNDVTTQALPPLANLADNFGIRNFAPKSGAFDLSQFSKASPMLSRARVALDDVDVKASRIDTTHTVPQIGAAIDQLKTLVGETKKIVDGLDSAAKLLPSMLGGDGPRSYLLLSLNNAELRASGGIPGSIAVLGANNGRLTIEDQSTANAIPEFAAPILPLSASETLLYKRTLGTYMQDVTFTPDFARSAELAQAMWTKYRGTKVDGVISIDPVALSYILSATGPVTAGNGVTLNSENAVRLLLSDGYAMFPKHTDEDVFFAGVTGHIFAALTGGATNNQKLIDALSRSADEHRINVWSSHDEEEVLLRLTPLSSGLPVSTKSNSAFGVYLNDGTGGKMDYYLQGGAHIGSDLCRVDGRPNFEVKVDLTSTAPLNAGTALPRYVTAGGDFGIAPGNISTGVYIYAPPGSQAYSVKIDGTQTVFSAADHEGRSVAAVNLQLTPGQTSEVVIEFLGKKGSSISVSLDHTPMASAMTTSVDDYLDCRGVQPTDHSVSGALGRVNSLHL